METGQEFMPRYTSVDGKADTYLGSGGIRLKGVDATCYQYGIRKALMFIAKKLGKEKKAKKWRQEARKIKNAIIKFMWDPKEEMFFDINPENWQRTKIKAAVCFYPYIYDIANKSHLNGFKKHLFNKNEFWTSYPVPATALSEPLANPFGEWKEKRMNCPWNGRVWPMTNSHIAEALANVSIKFDDTFKKTTVQFIKKTIEMMFLNRNLKYPNTYEHYNPFSGKSSLYRGVNDYQHSWIIDLIMKYICGIVPQIDNSLKVNPFPTGLEYFKIDNISYKGYKVKIELNDNNFKVYVDGNLKKESTIGNAVVLNLSLKYL